MVSPNMAAVLKVHSFSASCSEVLSDQVTVYVFQSSFIFQVSKLASAVPPVPFWNMDDKGRWPLWLMRNAERNLLVNRSPGCKYFSACHRAEGWSPKSRKGWRWLFLSSGRRCGGGHIFCSGDENSLTVWTRSTYYYLWNICCGLDSGYWLIPGNNNCLLEVTWRWIIEPSPRLI